MYLFRRRRTLATDLLPFVVILVIVVIVAGIVNGTAGPPAATGRGASAQSGRPGNGLPAIDDPTAMAEYGDRLAKRSGGDFSRLSDDERAWMDSVSTGHGAAALQLRYRALTNARDGRRAGGRPPASVPAKP